jgi:outer membrane protein OmpA-like peptidoglycan-associated protein
VLFAVDSAEIGPDALPAIGEVAEASDGGPDLSIVVACYTDATGTSAWNLSLSQARARAVAAALVSAGVPSSAITTRGYGATDFVAVNASPTGRARNRRCQITLQSDTR